MDFVAILRLLINIYKTSLGCKRRLSIILIGVCTLDSQISIISIIIKYHMLIGGDKFICVPRMM